MDVANKLCQVSLFDDGDENKTYVVYIDDWKLTDSTVKKCIKDLHALSTVINLAIESATVKNKIFSELDVDVIKATAVTRKAKALIVHKLLSNAKIKLDANAEDKLLSLLPDKIDFIKNELTKLQLMGQSTFTQEEIETIIFDLGDATVFNIVDS
ncbi:MAG: hypothetical protein MJ233_00885 [Mycoplasmoidaceae bacterium]|nr:hypothetical protein [Mycoplasmoidaceae bacterium]